MSKYDVLGLTLDNWVISRLSEPFSNVKFRVGNAGTVLAYIDSRQVVDRLNEIVGSSNWNDSYEQVTLQNTDISLDLPATVEQFQLKNPEKKIDTAFWTKGTSVTGIKDKSVPVVEKIRDIYYGGVECTLTVLGISHADVGTPSMSEELKGAYSDAIKRAAVKFGIGSYLYELKGLSGEVQSNQVVSDSVELPDWALPATRPNPDDALKPLVEEFITKTEYNTVDTQKYVHSILNCITVFGKYDTSAPLIVKRAVFELLNQIKGRA